MNGCIGFVFFALCEYAILLLHLRTKEEREKEEKKKRLEMKERSEKEQSKGLSTVHDTHNSPPATVFMEKRRHHVVEAAPGAAANGNPKRQLQQRQRRQNWLEQMMGNYKSIDGFSIIFFPAVFLAFNLTYWNTYLG